MRVRRRKTQFAIWYYRPSVQARLSIPASLIAEDATSASVQLEDGHLIIQIGAEGCAISRKACYLPEEIKRRLDLEVGSNAFDPIRIRPDTYVLRVREKGG
jgi:hypothetical protein